MRLESAALCLFVLAFAACRRNDEAATAPAAVVKNVNPPATATEARAEGNLPGERTPLEEGRIDAKSPEAAGQVVQSYGALIEQRRFIEAGKLWSDPMSAAGFASKLADFPEVHVEIGKPGDTDGAAGSIYVTMPITFYGKRTGGAAFRQPATVILRRVNDVPGSTEDQRRWHIDRIDLGSG
jgi:hypothetical protein